MKEFQKANGLTADGVAGEKTLSKPFFGPGVRKTEIRVAKMGNDAGIVGAAMMGKACFDDKIQG